MEKFIYALLFFVNFYIRRVLVLCMFTCSVMINIFGGTMFAGDAISTIESTDETRATPILQSMPSLTI